MKKLIIGFIIGVLIGGGVGYAASVHIKLQSEDGTAISAANPLPIAIQ